MKEAPPRDPVAGGWRGRVLELVAGMVLLYLFVPVFVIVLYSFNKPEGRFNFVWKALSLDDFIITLFNAGARVTYPLFVYGAQRSAYPPQVNVMATVILVFSLLVLGATYLWQRRTEQKHTGR